VFIFGPLPAPGTQRGGGALPAPSTQKGGTPQICSGNSKRNKHLDSIMCVYFFFVNCSSIKLENMNEYEYNESIRHISMRAVIICSIAQSIGFYEASYEQCQPRVGEMCTN